MDEVEQVQGTPASWEQLLLEEARGRCANCGGRDHLRPRMIVPTEAGGQRVSSNGTVLCRACDMAMDAALSRRSSTQQRPINFWCSRRLHDRLQNGLRTRAGFASTGALVRYLMTQFVVDPRRFSDLDQFQEEGDPDVKVNAWVSNETYEVFKSLAEKSGNTVTDTIKALICLYEHEAETQIDRRA